MTIDELSGNAQDFAIHIVTNESIDKICDRLASEENIEDMKRWNLTEEQYWLAVTAAFDDK